MSDFHPLEVVGRGSEIHLPAVKKLNEIISQGKSQAVLRQIMNVLSN